MEATKKWGEGDYSSWCDRPSCRSPSSVLETSGQAFIENPFEDRDESNMSESPCEITTTLDELRNPFEDSEPHRREGQRVTFDASCSSSRIRGYQNRQPNKARSNTLGNLDKALCGDKSLLLVNKIANVYRLLVDATLIKLDPYMKRCDIPKDHVDIVRNNMDQFRRVGLNFQDMGVALATAGKFGDAGSVPAMRTKHIAECMIAAVELDLARFCPAMGLRGLAILEALFCFITGVDCLQEALGISERAVIKGIYFDQSKRPPWVRIKGKIKKTYRRSIDSLKELFNPRPQHLVASTVRFELD